MEAWRRQLNDPVSAFPIAKAGPAHIATLKTFDPPLQALEGRQLRGVERRGKRLLFPTADGELVLLVHLMTSGRLKSLRAGESGPKTPAFALEFAGGSQARPHGEREAQARRRLAADARSRRRQSSSISAPRRSASTQRSSARSSAASRDDSIRCSATSASSPASAARGRTRSSTPRSSRPYARSADLSDEEVERLATAMNDELAARPRATRSRRRRREDLPRAQEARRAVPRLRHADRPGRLRGAHDLLLPECQTGGRILKDRRLSRLLR